MKNFLSKSFAVAAVTALAIPFASYLQSNDILPGSKGTESFASFDKVVSTQPYTQKGKDLSAFKVKEFSESFVDVKEDSIIKDSLNTDISGTESAIGFAILSPAFSLVSLALARRRDKNAHSQLDSYSSGLEQSINKDAKFGLKMHSFNMVADSPFVKSPALSSFTKGAEAGAGLAILLKAASVPPVLAYQAIKTSFFSDPNPKI